MKIPDSIIPITYQLSKEVFLSQKTHKEALHKLVIESHMNATSAAFYLNNFKYLMTGKTMKKTLNAHSMNYFLESINNDFGFIRLNNAVESLKNHINYYESFHHGRLYKLRKVLEKYLQMLPATDDIEQNEIIEIEENRPRASLISELRALSPLDPVKVVINHKAYKRDNKTIAQIKILRDYKCQICGYTLIKKDGRKYIEAAHIKPKCDQGPETPSNIILLCPNHHKEFDLGNKKIIAQSEDLLTLELNDHEYDCDLSIR